MSSRLRGNDLFRGFYKKGGFMRTRWLAVGLWVSLGFAAAMADPALDAALVNAAALGDMKRVQSLLDQGAQIEGRMPTNHWTPLMGASMTGGIEMVRFLLGKGAHTNAVTPDGTSVLIIAAMAGDVPTIELLLKHGAKLEYQENRAGATALIMAASENQAEAVKALLNAGANPNAKTKRGETALKVAQDNKNAEIAKLLKSHGAK